MKMFGKNIKVYEDEMPLDSDETLPLLWGNSNRNGRNALSQNRDKAANDKAVEGWKDKANLDGRKTVLCDEFWEDFVLLAKVCALRNPDADLYDVFETIRTKFLGGWGYTDSFLAKLDAEIEREESRYA